MKKLYVLTGFEKETGKMNTQLRRSIDDIFQDMKYFCPGVLEKRYKTVRDLDFDVNSRRSHEGAVIISDEKYSWSIFLVK